MSHSTSARTHQSRQSGVSSNSSDSDVSYPLPEVPGKQGIPIPLTTNAYGVKIFKDGIYYRYHVAVLGQVSPEKEVDLAKVAQDQGLIRNRRQQCFQLLRLLSVLCDNFDSEHPIWYDGQHFLVTPYDLFRTIPERSSFTVLIEQNTLPPECVNFHSVQITIKKEHIETVALTKADLLEWGRKKGEAKNTREALRLLELATNQYCLTHPDSFLCFKHGKVYLPNGEEMNFAAGDSPQLSEGTVLLPGSAKSAAFIEGPSGRHNGNISLVVDASKALFHMNEPLLEKYAKMFTTDGQLQNVTKNAKAFTSIIKGLFVSAVHLKAGKTFKIIEIDASQTAENCEFDYNGGKINVANYFKHRYNLPLKYSRLPLVHCKSFHLRQGIFLPIELCVVAPNQRVTIQQQTPRVMQEAVRLSALPPAKRKEDIEKHMEAMQLHNEENPFLSGLGVRIVTNLKVSGRLLSAPTLIYGKEKVPCAEGKWRTRVPGYVTGGRLETWAIFFIAEFKDRTASEIKCKAFGSNFINECKRRGLRVNDPQFINFLQMDASKTESNLEILDEMFSYAKSNACQFLFTVCSDQLPLHNAIKYRERVYTIPNQDLKMSTANKIAEGKSVQTLENVVNKFNVKLNGFNYNLERSSNHNTQGYLKNDRLIVGVSLATVESKSEESKDQRVVFGYAANPKANPNEFIGSFRYNKDTEKKTALELILADMFGQYQAAHSDQLPAELVIYWAGTSEGEVSKIMKDIVMGGIIESLAHLGRKPKLTFIMAIKRQHNMRIFKDKVNPQERPPQQNIPAGVVVDSKLTDPLRKQFFLNSHITLQGSAATPCYTVLYDDIYSGRAESMDELQAMTWGLAHLHQIATMCTSLPTPLYVAAEYTKRGMALLQEKIRAGGDGPEDELTAALSYTGTALSGRRINA